MKHDEKKIEEIIKNQELDTLHYNVTPYHSSKYAMKQYSEHMVQKERKRVIGKASILDKKITESLEQYSRSQKGEWGMSLEVSVKSIKDSIINLINKEDE